MSEVSMIIGLPASGKSSLVQQYQNCRKLNRDSVGGGLDKLLPAMRQAILAGENVVLDNLNATVESRKPFIDLAKELGVTIRAEWMMTQAEDCQINALIRMWKRYGQVFFIQMTSRRMISPRKTPNIFPITVIFTYKKQFEKPTTAEGFASINKVEFVRVWDDSFVNKAIFLDYDGTLRDVQGGRYKFPTDITEIKIRSGVRPALKMAREKGYMLFGVSNQSGIARGQVTDAVTRQLFQDTNDMLYEHIEVAYCPHNVPPVCYCRKPQSGLAIPFIMKYKIDVKKSLMVGDQTSDKTFAERLGMKFMYPDEFFRRD